MNEAGPLVWHRLGLHWLGISPSIYSICACGDAACVIFALCLHPTYNLGPTGNILKNMYLLWGPPSTYSGAHLVPTLGST